MPEIFSFPSEDMRTVEIRLRTATKMWSPQDSPNHLLALVLSYPALHHRSTTAPPPKNVPSIHQFRYPLQLSFKPRGRGGGAQREGSVTMLSIAGFFFSPFTIIPPRLKLRRVAPLSLRGYERWATCGQSTLTGSPLVPNDAGTDIYIV